MIIASFNGVQVEYRPAQFARPAGTYVVVKNDYDMTWVSDAGISYTKLDRNTRNEIFNNSPLGSRYLQNSGRAVPATARFLDDTFVNFTCELQWWIHEMNVERARPFGGTPDNLKSDFASCFRGNVWMSNFAGTNQRLDCINNNGLDPFVQLQPMATGGSVLKVVGETVYKREACYLIEAIHPSDFQRYNVKSHRWLFFHPTLSARYWLEYEAGNDGHPDRTTRRQNWYQEPMHFYREQTIIPVFGFMRDARSSTGFVNVIEKSRVRILTGEVPNPFIMRFGRSLPNPYSGF